MLGRIKNILKFSAVAIVAPCVAFSVQQTNPRNSANSSGRTESVRSSDSVSNASVRRAATSVIARSTSNNNRQNRAVVTARPASARSATVQVRSARPVIKNATQSRSATKPTLARSGAKKSAVNISRAGTARATAVFNDVTKIGGGYADCRDSYATCMDQLCANANDTYRRCYCSDKFIDFRETENRLDEALTLLADFQNNNLNAVDKSAAEVNAMYTATAGEEAIKRDTSASQKLLDSIGDVLAGKSTPTKQNTLSLGVLDLSGFGSSDDDIWGGSSSSLFGSSATDISTLEGKDLYNNAAKQCAEITASACSSDAMFNLARSAYSIMITQDCNMYEKNINAKKSSVEETVRTAEKYLREARLEEYRSHNSADVNECLSKVETALRQSTACGENYEKCMDYTGLYINSSTGEPIYSQALFGLNNLIVLDGSADVLGANPDFNKMLESKKMFATTALDSCRDLADTVWSEFKRSAIIQIAQAQDEKIQQVKDSCVVTIKECYDTQTGAMQELDSTESQSTAAITAVAARGMCYDRVQACAALYGDPDGCAYDDKTKKLSAVAGKTCGLQSLLAFVDTVDSVKVAEGCETALTKYAHELCDEDIGTEDAIPYGKCKDKPKAELRAAMEIRMKTFCAQDLVNADESNTISEQSAFNTNIMNQIIKDIYDSLGIAFTAGCEDDSMGGMWVYGNEGKTLELAKINQDFYKKYYGAPITSMQDLVNLNSEDMGWCEIVPKPEEDAVNQCSILGDTYCDAESGELTEAWYMHACEDMLDGKWQNETCVIMEDEKSTSTKK